MATQIDKPASGGRIGADLSARIASGIVLAGLALALDYFGSVPFALFVGAVGLAMCWEWGRVVREGAVGLPLAAHMVAVVVAVALAAKGSAILALVALAVGAIVMVPLCFGERAVVSALGVPYIGLPIVALLWLRSSEPYGFLAILFLFLVVATTDTAAYFTGRLLGGPKLWPRVSPNKTWSGFLGGISASGLMGAAFGAFLTGGSPAALALSAFALGIVAQGGDLAESALKRGFGVKDASTLIPGHGGFMDRMDSIVSVAIAAAAIAFLLNAEAPARALLLGH